MERRRLTGPPDSVLAGEAEVFARRASLFPAMLLSCAAAQAQHPPPAPTAAAAQQAAALPVVRLIATGGTIAMKIDPVKHAPVPAISGEDLVATVPEIQKV